MQLRFFEGRKLFQNIHNVQQNKGVALVIHTLRFAINATRKNIYPFIAKNQTQLFGNNFFGDAHDAVTDDYCKYGSSNVKQTPKRQKHEWSKKHKKLAVNVAHE